MKINIWQIIFDHIDTLRNDTSKKISIIDIIIFFIAANSCRNCRILYLIFKASKDFTVYRSHFSLSRNPSIFSNGSIASLPDVQKGWSISISNDASYDRSARSYTAAHRSVFVNHAGGAHVSDAVLADHVEDQALHSPHRQGRRSAIGRQSPGRRYLTPRSSALRWCLTPPVRSPVAPETRFGAIAPKSAGPCRLPAKLIWRTYVWN